jgi:hypothetical protein
MHRSEIRGGRPSRQFGFAPEIRHGASNWTSIPATPLCVSRICSFQVLVIPNRQSFWAIVSNFVSSRRVQINVASRFSKAAKTADPNFANPETKPEEKE